MVLKIYATAFPGKHFQKLQILFSLHRKVIMVIDPFSPYFMEQLILSLMNKKCCERNHNARSVK